MTSGTTDGGHPEGGRPLSPCLAVMRVPSYGRTLTRFETEWSPCVSRTQ